MKYSQVMQKRRSRISRSHRVWPRLGIFERLEDRRLMAVFENFDGVTAPNLPADWTQTSTSTNPWTTVAGANSDSPANHAFVVNLPSVSDSQLTSPSFVLSAATPILTFRNAYDTESTWDGGVLEISINSGAFSDILAAGGSFISGGYTGPLNTGTPNPLAGRQAWSGSSGGYITTNVNLPTAALGEEVSLRWRLGSDSFVSGSGWRIDTVSLNSPPTDDFGDAPTAYPVTLAENGARHTRGALFLGATIDTEFDGVHSPSADSDGSDEDGVAFPTSASTGTSIFIPVTASIAGGFLNAWIDWNADGDWSDSGEKVFDNLVLAAGINSLPLNIPIGASLGLTFARFRLGASSGLGITGPAVNGEVEDYAISISSLGVWVDQGPSPGINGQENVPPNNQINGAVQAIAVNPTNADEMYIGAVNGGIWKSTNANALSPHWVPLIDNFRSLSIGALEFDPTDASRQTLIAGTGTLSSFGATGDERRGVLYTTNGGNSWTELGVTALSNQNLTSVAARGMTLLAASDNTWGFGAVSGLFRSANGGAAWTTISGTNGLPTGNVSDLVGDPASSNVLYAAVTGAAGGVFRSTDTGLNWTNVTAGIGIIGSSTNKIEVAVHNNAGVVAIYASVANNSSTVGIFRSLNGAAFTALNLPITGGQGDLHMSIVAHPTNPNLVFVGGAAGSQFLTRIDASASLGSQITNIATGTFGTPHVDTREMAIDANGNLVLGTDGGLFRLPNPTTNTGTWVAIVGDLSVFELHNIAYDSISNVIAAGAQDNGTLYQLSQNNLTWDHPGSGDGGDVAIDDISQAGSGRSIRYRSSQNLGGWLREVYGSNNVRIGSTVALATISDPQFVTPVQLNKVDPTRILVGGATNLYESFNQGTTLNNLGPPGANGTFNGLPMVYGGFQGGVPNVSLIYAGRNSRVFLRTTAGGPITATSILPAGGGTVVDLTVDSGNWSNVFVIDSNQIFQSTNAGSTWSDVTGNIASISQTVFNSIEFVPGAAGGTILIGTNSGVFYSKVSAIGVWTKLGQNIPNAIVYDLEYDSTDNILVAGTMGRGAWSFPNLISLLEDIIPPKIVDVKVGNLTWNSSFINFVDPSGTGYPIPDGASQSLALPWSNIDRIFIQFSEDLGSSFSQSSILLTGINVPNYASLIVPGGVTFNKLNNVGTIELTASLGADKLRLTVLSTVVTDVAGNLLDGEWTDDVTVGASGNGTAGGNFAYRINVLPGDVDGSGAVLSNDVTAVVNKRLTTAGGPGYIAQADIDASSSVLSNDVTAVVNRRLTSLPAGNPPEAPIAPLSSNPAVPSLVGNTPISSSSQVFLAVAPTPTSLVNRKRVRFESPMIGSYLPTGSEIVGPGLSITDEKNSVDSKRKAEVDAVMASLAIDIDFSPESLLKTRTTRMRR